MSCKRTAKDEIGERMMYKDRTRKHNMKNEKEMGVRSSISPVKKGNPANFNLTKVAMENVTGNL